MNQGDKPNAPVEAHVRRKRGRPRKHPSLNQGLNARVPSDHNQNHADHPRVPKDRKLNHGMNGHQTRPVEPDDNKVDAMVGKAVSGVIEASFDAGYLINVRVGNSETTLRGVVFKPGHYVPISMVNDVAPDVHMIRRNEVPLPTENSARVHGSQRNGTRHAFSDSVANPATSRGNVVPVVLEPMDQPIGLSNGLPLANQPSPVLSGHHSSSKGKQVPIVAPQAPNPSNGATLDGSTDKMPSKDSDAFCGMDEPLFVEPLQSVQPHQHNHSPLEMGRVGRMTELLQVVQEKMTENRS